MTATIIQFPEMLKGNGAREALTEILTEPDPCHFSGLTKADALLSELWLRGFMIVPIEGTTPGEAASGGDAV